MKIYLKKRRLIKIIPKEFLSVIHYDDNGNLLDDSAIFNSRVSYFEYLKKLKDINIEFKNLGRKPQLSKLNLFADNLPITWGKIVRTSAADYEDHINELWGAGKYRSAKWNQKLAWLCALSNLGHYLWLKAWKPVSTVFRRLL